MPLTQDEIAAGIVYFVPDLDRFAQDLSLATDDANAGLTFEKEVIHIGDFIKHDKKTGEQRFTVNEPVLQHWKNTTDLMLANGVKIPCPLGHSVDPEKNRAEVTGFRLGKNSRGMPAGFAKIKFRDKNAAQLAQSADMSIFVTADFTDGKGTKYKAPIRHIALTDYPVIPNLDKFQAIAASFDDGAGTVTSKLLPLAQQLGVPRPEEMDDAGLTEAVIGMFQLLKDQIDELKTSNSSNNNNLNFLNPGGTMSGTGNTGASTRIPKAFAASFSGMLKDSRLAKLESLVANNHILPVVKDELVKQYCSDEALALSLDGLNLDDESANKSVSSDAAFNNLVEALKKNKALKTGEKTGAQIPNAVALSHDLGDDEKDDDNSLTRKAEARAKVAQRN